MYNGIINVYKEPGWTSFDVVARLRTILGQKKIGHTGTLDPDAEGVLPVCLGSATKVCELLTDRDKTYVARMLLGITTDTLDTGGQVLERKEVSGLDPEQVRQVIGSFQGVISQIPPMYSALKINGQKLCDLARQGITVERKSRQVEIYDISILEMDLPEVTMEVHCSKGTYIRTLCDDIGRKLGCGGVMDHLIRTKAAGYEVKDALSLEEILRRKENGTISEVIRSVDSVFYMYPEATVAAESLWLLHNGNALEDRNFLEAPDRENPVRVYDPEGNFCALYQYRPDKLDFKPVKMFLAR